MKHAYIIALLLGLVAVGSLTIRLPQLGLRPMHADEAVQAKRFDDLWHGAGYRYDPDEFHGPVLSYATLPSIWISCPETFAETTEFTFRIVPVVFGAGLILLLVFLADGLGKTATVGASGLLAFSPAMVFYSRYYIHETLLAFFTLAAVAAAWRYRRGGQLRWCVAAGVCVGLMQVTKETAVLAYLAAGVALVFVRYGPGQSSAHEKPIRPRWHIVCGLATAILIVVLFLSSFGGHLRGPLDGVLTYLPWLRRAGGGSVHVHPWYFYLQRLAWWKLADGPLWSEGLISALAAVWSEGLILALAAVAMVSAFLRPRSLPAGTDPILIRWLGVYTLSLTIVYSAIPYKTPWCLLQFLLGFVLLAGVGLAVLLWLSAAVWWRAIVSIGLSVLAVHLVWQAHRASFVLPTDPQNPYVYAQTANDVLRLADDVQQLAQATEGSQPVSVKVIWKDGYYWPLPWYFRRCQPVGYCIGVPDQVNEGVVVAASQFDAELTQRLDETHLMTGFYGLRPGVLAQLWVRLDVWQDHLRRLGRLPAETP